MKNLDELKFPFPEEEIEWRIGSAGKKGNGQYWAMCLAYVSARAIMNRLDNVCGPENWKTSYDFVPSGERIEPGVICKLSIKIGAEWVTKEDGAEQTDFEPFKGGISSALKRAGSAWGIGRYLYGLDSGWATISDSRTKGAKYHQSKKEGMEFYWMPPNLPAWALPDPSKVKSNGVRPEQPGMEDGSGHDQVYVFNFGQYRGKTVEQIYNENHPKCGPDGLKSYVRFLDEQEAKGKLTIAAAEARKHIEDFLGVVENTPV